MKVKGENTNKKIYKTDNKKQQTPFSKKSQKNKKSNLTTNSIVIKKILDHKLFNNNNIFYKVNEIAKLTGLSRQQIHVYTQLGLIKESFRSKSGHRFYSKDTINRIFLIEMLKRHRTLSEVRELLKNKYSGDKDN